MEAGGVCGSLLFPAFKSVNLLRSIATGSHIQHDLLFSLHEALDTLFQEDHPLVHYG